MSAGARPVSSMASLAHSDYPQGQKADDMRARALQTHERYALMLGGNAKKQPFARIDPDKLLESHMRTLQQSPRERLAKQEADEEQVAKKAKALVTFTFDDCQSIALDDAYCEFRKRRKRDLSATEASDLHKKIEELFANTTQLLSFHRSRQYSSSVLDTPDPSDDDDDDGNAAAEGGEANGNEEKDGAAAGNTGNNNANGNANDENNGQADKEKEKNTAAANAKIAYSQENIKEMPFDIRLLRKFVRKQIVEQYFVTESNTENNNRNEQQQLLWFSHEDENLQFASSFESLRGPRTYQEDEYLSMSQLNDCMGWSERGGKQTPKQSIFAIFDGHGGKMASRQARIHLHRLFLSHPEMLESPTTALFDAFIEADKLINEYAEKCGEESGTTAIVALIRDNRVWVANVGDSQGVLSRGGVAFEVSNIHSPSRSDEKARISAGRGAVVWLGTWRVNGVMAVSRSLGDNRLKNLLIASPEISEYVLQASDDFLLLATDGLWDVVSPQEAVDYVHATLKKASGSSPAALDALRHELPELLCNLALEKQSKDNVSVVIVWFHFLPRPSVISSPSLASASCGKRATSHSCRLPTDPAEDFANTVAPQATAAATTTTTTTSSASLEGEHGDGIEEKYGAGASSSSSTTTSSSSSSSSSRRRRKKSGSQRKSREHDPQHEEHRNSSDDNESANMEIPMCSVISLVTEISTPPSSRRSKSGSLTDRSISPHRSPKASGRERTMSEATSPGTRRRSSAEKQRKASVDCLPPDYSPKQEEGSTRRHRHRRTSSKDDGGEKSSRRRHRTLGLVPKSPREKSGVPFDPTQTPQ